MIRKSKKLAKKCLFQFRKRERRKLLAVSVMGHRSVQRAALQFEHVLLVNPQPGYLRLPLEFLYPHLRGSGQMRAQPIPPVDCARPEFISPQQLGSGGCPGFSLGVPAALTAVVIVPNVVVPVATTSTAASSISPVLPPFQ
jgi:hypothetical protein